LRLFVETLGFGVVLASITAIGAMGFTIQFGLTNILNLSYASIMTVTAFVAWLLQAQGINIWIGFILGGVAGAALTLLLGKTVFKVYARRQLKLFEMVMVTLGLSIVIQYIVYVISRDQIYQFTFSPGRSVSWGPIHLTVTEVVIIALGAVIFVGLELLLRRTKLGTALRAMAADASLANSCGIPTGRIVTFTWLLSGFLCGLAGVVFVINTMSVDYGTGSLALPLVLSAAVLGGIGSPTGAVVASLVMGTVTELVSAYGGSAYGTVAAFGVLVVVLLARPSAVLNAASNKMEMTV